MSDIALHVEDLSKQYRLGPSVRYKTLRDTLTDAFSAPLRSVASVLKRAGHSDNRGDERSNHTFWALENVSFDVKQGEIVGIIGRNGAGKSTLLKILSRITDPTTGCVDVFGRVGSLLEVGTGFHPELTGRENIYLNGAILGMRKKAIQNRFDEIVTFAEVEKFIDTPVKHYSSGMYVRLAFAVAAHLEPEILLVDEVLAVGDAEFQKKCLGKMGDIGREGRTVLMVSHNMPSIVNLCQRAVLLGKGKIEKDGRASEVVQYYLATARSGDGEVRWPDPAQAPGNDIVRLHSVRILQDSNEGPTADVDISKDVLIQITYQSLRSGELLYPAIWLRDQIGTVVLSSGNAGSMTLTMDSWYGQPYPTGLFQSVCRIPGNFLNEGLYSVTAILGKLPANTIVLEDYLLSFQVHDTGAMRKEFYGGWIGVVRPKLSWYTKQIE